MITGEKVVLRPIRDEDWEIIGSWAESRDALWGAFQRFQLDHLPLLKQAYQRSGLLTREGGMLLVETIEDSQIVGFVRYSMLSVPDGDHPHPEIGFGVPEVSARRRGYGKEAVALLVAYIFSGYPTQRITAFTDAENIPAQHLMEGLGFHREGMMRKSYFCDGDWHDIALYASLRESFVHKPEAA